MTSPDLALDLDFARSQFPALVEHWPEWALMDNAGGSVTPRQVQARVTDYMRRYMVQLGASHVLSQQATGIVSDAHAFGAQLVGARTGEIALGPSSTMCAKLLAGASA